MVHFLNLDKSLTMWILQQQFQNILLSTELIKEQDQHLVEMLAIPKGRMEFSNSWFEKFLSCHKLKVIKMHEEASSTNQVVIDITMYTLHTYITSYDLCDVYDISEMGMFYNMVHDQIVA